MLYQLNLILNYNQGLALFRQKQILRSTSQKYLQKRNNGDFFIKLLNAWLHLTNESFPVPTSVKEILDQTHISKSTAQTDSLFSSPRKFQTDFLFFIRELCVDVYNNFSSPLQNFAKILILLLPTGT